MLHHSLPIAIQITHNDKIVRMKKKGIGTRIRNQSPSNNLCIKGACNYPLPLPQPINDGKDERQ